MLNEIDSSPVARNLNREQELFDFKKLTVKLSNSLRRADTGDDDDETQIDSPREFFDTSGFNKNLFGDEK